MNKPSALVILTTAMLLVGTAAVAGAPQPGDLGVFFDAAGTTTSIEGVVAFASVNFYVIAFEVPGGLREYEFSVDLPPGVIVLAGRILPGPGCVDVDTGDDNYIIVCDDCLTAPAQSLVTYQQAVFLAAPPPDSQICLGPATPSSGPAMGWPPAPIYDTCRFAGDLHLFGSAYRGCAVINPAVLTPPIPDALAGWGALKATYGN
jgi:hypothetical protein